MSHEDILILSACKPSSGPAVVLSDELATFTLGYYTCTLNIMQLNLSGSL